MESLPGNYYNFHPGSHVGSGVQTGIDLISDALNQILFPNQSTIVLLETMAGKGSEVGSRFEEIKAIVAENLGADKASITPETSFSEDLKADSLDLFEMVMAFEEHFGVDIPAEDLEQLKTVGDVMSYVESHKA